MPNIEHHHCTVSNGKNHPILVSSLAKEQLPQLNSVIVVFSGMGMSLGELSQILITPENPGAEAREPFAGRRPALLWGAAVGTAPQSRGKMP